LISAYLRGVYWRSLLGARHRSRRVPAPGGARPVGYSGRVIDRSRVVAHRSRSLLPRRAVRPHEPRMGIGRRRSGPLGSGPRHSSVSGGPARSRAPRFRAALTALRRGPVPLLRPLSRPDDADGHGPRRPADLRCGRPPSRRLSLPGRGVDVDLGHRCLHGRDVHRLAQPSSRSPSWALRGRRSSRRFRHIPARRSLGPISSPQRRRPGPVRRQLHRQQLGGRHRQAKGPTFDSDGRP
jgi:hypothetical protein